MWAPGIALIHGTRTISLVVIVFSNPDRLTDAESQDLMMISKKIRIPLGNIIARCGIY